MKNLHTLEDHELVKLIQQHDTEAIGELYASYYEPVYRKCSCIVKDNDLAFDLAQESLIQAFEKISQFRGDSTFSTWLYIITHRHCLQALRKKKIVFMQDSYANIEDDKFSIAENSSDKFEEEQKMLGLLGKLPDDDQELLKLKYYDGISIAALQTMFHLSASGIKMRLKRAKEKEKVNELYAQSVAFDFAPIY